MVNSRVTTPVTVSSCAAHLLIVVRCVVYKQIKVRGQRVNIAEVERVVSQCPDVTRVVVLRHQLTDFADILVAYYTLSTSVVDTRRSSRRVKAACVTSLPVYMRPKLVLVDGIPLQCHSGKVDREALHQLYVARLNRRSCCRLATMSGVKKKVRSRHLL